MAVEAVTPRYPPGVSRSNSQLRRIRDVADSGIRCPTNPARIFFADRRRFPFCAWSGGLEIVGRNAVQKLFELFHLVLANGGGRLVVILVGDQQAGLREDGFLDVDRYTDP
jgi:hypothetical protein